MAQVEISSERVSEMGRSLGELQRELEVMRERAEDREKRTELSLEELEVLIAAKNEDTNRRLEEQAQENRETIDKVHLLLCLVVPAKGRSNESESPRG